MTTPNRSFRESFPFAANGNPNVKLRLDPRDAANFTAQYENRGDKTATIKVQDAADPGTGVPPVDGDYADVAGSSATVVPGGTKTVQFSVRKHFRFVASGGTEVEAILTGDINAHELTKV